MEGLEASVGSGYGESKRVAEEVSQSYGYARHSLFIAPDDGWCRA
jgi:hypothetical protein